MLGRTPVVGIGDISSDEAGFGVGPILDPENVRTRIEAVLRTPESAA